MATNGSAGITFVPPVQQHQVPILNTEHTSHDGNVVQKGIALHQHISRKFIGPNGVFTKFLITIDLTLLACFVLGQGYSLSLNIGGQTFTHFCLALDFLVVLIFYFSVISAKRHYEQKFSTDLDQRSNCRNFAMFGIRLRFPSQMGELPLMYLSWLLYTILLVVRIILIHTGWFFDNWISNFQNAQLRNEPVTHMSNLRGSAIMIELSYAVTSIIFLLFIEAHRNSEDDLHREQTHVWAEGLMQHTVFEIFDSVLLLDLIMPESNQRLIEDSLYMIILFLACTNFFLPSIGLYHLSQLSASTNNSCSSLNLVGMSRNILLHAFRLFGVNIAYLVIRVHMSSVYDRSMSIFIVKNLLGIFMALRSLFKETFEYVESKRKLKEKRNCQKKNVESGDVIGNELRTTSGAELNSANREISDQNFEEISLHSSQKIQTQIPQS